MKIDYVDLRSKAKELGVTEAVLRGRILSGAIDCFIFLKARVEATQEQFLPVWSHQVYPHVRWRDLGTAVDPSGTYEHGTREILSGRRRRTLPNPAYHVTGWVRLGDDLIAEVFTSEDPVSLKDWYVAVDCWTDETYVPVLVTGDSLFVYEEGYATKCQKICVEDVMFFPNGKSASAKNAADALDPRREKSLLRIIRALDVMAKLPVRGAATSVDKQLQEMGFNGPNDETIRAILEEARLQKPEKSQ